MRTIAISHVAYLVLVTLKLYVKQNAHDLTDKQMVIREHKISKVLYIEFLH